ncbi:uncharacterized protein LOC116254842 [Nymphaea colorata]|uniref:uncharacterized protein LOC116254842 n=1 Tax=Nymphaea colorata TaxID=210225 RepID=UPI00129DD446|nr:uncharacterized protein LOC116254842 [Nymphaea colorata]
MAERAPKEIKNGCSAGDDADFNINGADIQVLSDPFYIHHSDNPGNALVSQSFNGEIYGTWSRAMVMALSVKNKIKFIDGSIIEPNKNDPNHRLWVRCNNLVLSWILNSVTKDILVSIIYSTNAREVWQDLKERLTQSLAPRIFQIQSSTQLQQDTMSVALYYTKLMALWDELGSYSLVPICSCGAMKAYSDQIQRECVMQFLMGLNDSYNSIKGHILLVDHLSNINKV